MKRSRRCGLFERPNLTYYYSLRFTNAIIYPKGLHIRLENTTYDSPTRFGYEILRDHVLPSILGKHEDEILYWAGKEVARKFPIFGIDELPDFFQEAGWGPLNLKRLRKTKHFIR